MTPITFDQLPTQIQSIFAGKTKKQCTCFVKLIKGEERYYVNVYGETTVFHYVPKQGWTHLRSYSSS